MLRRLALSAVLTALVVPLATLPGRGAESGVAWKQYHVRSPASGKIERFWVGHRNGLDPKGSYPAVYFLPGLLDHDATWKNALDAHLGKHDVVAVCTSVGGGTWFMNSTEHPWMRWGDFLTRELPAFIEATYPVSSEKGQRGAAGISAGGHAALYHALTKPNLYGSVTVMSGAVDLRGYVGGPGLDVWLGGRADPGARYRYGQRSCLLLMSQQPPPLPFALAMEAGESDGARGQMEPLHRLLAAKAIVHRWNVAPGGHNWTLWAKRAPDVLAWHAEQFALNRQAKRYREEPPEPETALELINGPPDIGLSDEARRRLRAPWRGGAAGEAVKSSGIPDEGAPLRKDAKADGAFAKASFGANPPIRGLGAGLFVYRLGITVAVPLPKAGTVTLRGRLRNGRRATIVSLPAIALPVPAGEPQRKVTLRARVAVELKAPGPLRGGVLMAVQPFDADGQPVGDPVVGKARPGTAQVEQWPIDPRAGTLWDVTLSGDDALPLAAVHGVALYAEAEEP